MARLDPPPIKTSKIKKFLGVNENPDGDTNLKMGEAADMSNFKITKDFALQKRPGTIDVAGLLSTYTVATSETKEIVASGLNAPTETFVSYPTISVSDGGVLALSGTSVNVTASNITENTTKYCDIMGNKYKIGTYTLTAPSTGTLIDGGSIDLVSSVGMHVISSRDYTTYSSVKVLNGKVVVTGTPSTDPGGTNVTGRYYYYFGNVYKILDVYEFAPFTYNWTNEIVNYVADNTYKFEFYSVTATTESTDTEVKGIWSGRIGGDEIICAACNGKLWALEETDGVWTKNDAGTLDTRNPVFMFGYDEKLYLMNGLSYKVWDGVNYFIHTYTGAMFSVLTPGDYSITANSINYIFTLSESLFGHYIVLNENDGSLTLDGVALAHTHGEITTQTDLPSAMFYLVFGGFGSWIPLVTHTEERVYHSIADVEGYVPLVHHARTYDGVQTTELERINMLTGKRRVWFSPDGTHATFTLPEKGLVSVDYAKTIATDAALTISSSDLTNGTTALSANPAAGTDTIEIGYTVANPLRSKITAMTLAELYNGQNDNRVFIYGDGSNKAYYSGLDYNGQPTAEYFPDMSEIKIGDSNTPIYDLLRDQDELIAFKDGSAYRIKFGQISLVNGTATAAFFTTDINKNIGSMGYGQAQLVENYPRTLDKRSIYEWVSSSLLDQESAQRISQKVETTLRSMDLTKAITFNDEINHEYYVVENGTAIIQNTENKTWYIYEDFPAICMIVYKDELYIGTSGGYIKHVSRDYLHDCGEPIVCYWESGNMDFGMDKEAKNSSLVWVTLENETNAAIQVSAKIRGVETTAVPLVSSIKEVHRCKIKAKKFTHYKLILKSTSADTTATILGADIDVMYSGNAK